MQARFLSLSRAVLSAFPRVAVTASMRYVGSLGVPKTPGLEHTAAKKRGRRIKSPLKAGGGIVDTAPATPAIAANAVGKLSVLLGGAIAWDVEQRLLSDFARVSTKGWIYVHGPTLKYLDRALPPVLASDVQEIISYIYGSRSGTLSATPSTAAAAGAAPTVPPSSLEWLSRRLSGHPEVSIWIEKLVLLRLTVAVFHADRLVPSKRITRHTINDAVARKRLDASPSLPEPPVSDVPHAPSGEPLAPTVPAPRREDALSYQLLRLLMTDAKDGPPLPAQLAEAHACLREEARAVAYALLHLLFPIASVLIRLTHTKAFSTSDPYTFPPELDRYISEAEQLFRSAPGPLVLDRQSTHLLDRFENLSRANHKKMLRLMSGLYEIDVRRQGRHPVPHASCAALARPLLAAYLGDTETLTTLTEECVRESTLAARSLAAQVAANLEKRTRVPPLSQQFDVLKKLNDIARDAHSAESIKHRNNTAVYSPVAWRDTVLQTLGIPDALIERILPVEFRLPNSHGGVIGDPALPPSLRDYFGLLRGGVAALRECRLQNAGCVPASRASFVVRNAMGPTEIDGRPSVTDAATQPAHDAGLPNIPCRALLMSVASALHDHPSSQAAFREAVVKLDEHRQILRRVRARLFVSKAPYTIFAQRDPVLRGILDIAMAAIPRERRAGVYAHASTAFGNITVEQVDAVFSAGSSEPDWSKARSTPVHKSRVSKVTPQAVAEHVAPYAAAEEASLEGTPRERALHFALLLAKVLNDQGYLRVRSQIQSLESRLKHIFNSPASSKPSKALDADSKRMLALYRGPVYLRAAELGKLMDVDRALTEVENECHAVFSTGLLNMHLDRALALSLEDGELTPAVLDEARRIVLRQDGRNVILAEKALDAENGFLADEESGRRSDLRTAKWTAGIDRALRDPSDDTVPASDEHPQALANLVRLLDLALVQASHIKAPVEEAGSIVPVAQPQASLGGVGPWSSTAPDRWAQNGIQTNTPAVFGFGRNSGSDLVTVDFAHDANHALRTYAVPLRFIAKRTSDPSRVAHASDEARVSSIVENTAIPRATSILSDGSEDWRTSWSKWACPNRHTPCKVLIWKLPLHTKQDDITEVLAPLGSVVRVELWQGRADVTRRLMADDEIRRDRASFREAEWRDNKKAAAAQVGGDGSTGGIVNTALLGKPAFVKPTTEAVHCARWDDVTIRTAHAPVDAESAGVSPSNKAAVHADVEVLDLPDSSNVDDDLAGLDSEGPSVSSGAVEWESDDAQMSDAADTASSGASSGNSPASLWASPPWVTDPLEPALRSALTPQEGRPRAGSSSALQPLLVSTTPAPPPRDAVSVGRSGSVVTYSSPPSDLKVGGRPSIMDLYASWMPSSARGRVLQGSLRAVPPYTRHFSTLLQRDTLLELLCRTARSSSTQASTSHAHRGAIKSVAPSAAIHAAAVGANVSPALNPSTVSEASAPRPEPKRGPEAAQEKKGAAAASPGKQSQPRAKRGKHTKRSPSVVAAGPGVAAVPAAPAPVTRSASKRAKRAKSVDGSAASSSGAAGVADKVPQKHKKRQHSADAPTKKKAWEMLQSRRRAFNVSSPLVAFAYFATPEEAARATSPVLRAFGVVIHGQSCRTGAAAEQRVLHVALAVRGLSPEAARLTLSELLASLGDFDLTLADREQLRHGMLCNGEALVELESHEDALEVAHALSADPRLVVGWALPGEWEAARPRMPIYF